MFILDFVDSVAASPTVRLSLTGDNPWRTLTGTNFGTPVLDRAVSRTLLADGATPTAATYDNRLITLVLRVESDDPDIYAAALQSLVRELDRPRNVLRYQPETAQPVFFHTYRSEVTSIDPDPVNRTVTAAMLARPFGFGPEQTVTATLYADPHEGATLNSNPFFETDALSWTPTGGSFVRSTAQQHEGVASGLLTPTGAAATAQIESENCAIAASTSCRASAWVRCAVARNIDVGIFWYTAANAFISSSAATTAVAATTWTFLDTTATAPPTAAFARVMVRMTGTPPAGNTLHIDEARIRRPGGGGGAYIDVTGVKGDYQTPLTITGKLNSGSFARYAVLGVRRRGNPDNVPVIQQAEAFSLSGIVTAQPHDASASGGGNNFVRAAVTGVANTLLSKAATDYAPSTDLRGQYRAYVRGKLTVGTDTVKVWHRPGTIDGAQATWPQTTSWVWVDLGVFSIPQGADPQWGGYSNVELPAYSQGYQILGQRTAGTGALDLDVVAWMPADDQLMTAYLGRTTDRIVLDGPARMIYALDATGAVGTTVTNGPPSLPGGTSQINVSPGVTNRVYVLLGAPSPTTSNPAEDVFDPNAYPLTVSYWPRYLNVAAP